jgi:hypothetical protein
LNLVFRTLPPKKQGTNALFLKKNWNVDVERVFERVS